jgi:hypothetical protein
MAPGCTYGVRRRPAPVALTTHTVSARPGPARIGEIPAGLFVRYVGHTTQPNTREPLSLAGPVQRSSLRSSCVLPLGPLGGSYSRTSPMQYVVTAAFLLAVVAGSFAAVILGGYGIARLIAFAL